MRVENVIIYIFISCFITVSVGSVLQMVASYEKRKGMTILEKLLLTGMVMLSIYILWSFSPGKMATNICSMAILLTIAIIDGQTGYVYNCFSYYLLFSYAIMAMFKWPYLSRYELLLLSICILVVVLCVAFKGMGTGDMPIYFALMFYYLRYSECPADAAVLMLLLSQFLFFIGLLVNRTRKLPLIPYIWIAHIITMCIWC